MTMPDRERDRRSLQDLAKMAHGFAPPPSVGSSNSAPSGVQRAAEASKDDSGIVDLAAASQADPKAAERAQSTALASEGLFDDDATSVLPPPASRAPAAEASQGLPSQPTPTIPPAPLSVPPANLPQATAAASASVPSVVGAAAAAVDSTPVYSTPDASKKRSSTLALVVVGAVALGAAAAGTLLFTKPAKEIEPSASVAPPGTAAEPAPTAIAPAPAPVEETAAAAPAAAEEPTSAEPATTEATDEAPKLAKNDSKPAALAPAARATKGAAAKREDPGPLAQADAPAKVTEKDLGAAPSGPISDLGAAIQKEVGDDALKTPAAATMRSNAPTGNVPQKPSQGAVTGALGAVLPGARACLGPDDPISRASVAFSSDGTVQNVKVTGGAAGKPAEACIKTALGKAKLQPFAEPTYTANVTVRHN